MAAWQSKVMLTIATGVLLFLLGPADASARPAAAEKIPPNEWGCTLCHNGDGAGPAEVPLATASSLTSFGLQWLSLGEEEEDRLWGIMASLNADGDGCSNGCELNDPFGSYSPGDPPLGTRCAEGDPNVADCTLPLNEDSWSTLKALFGDN